MLIYLLQGASLALGAVITPGPLQAFIFSRALKDGWKRTLPAAFAPLVTDGPILILTVILLANMPQWFLHGLRVLGGLFILYLVRGIYRSLKNDSQHHNDSDDASKNTFVSAVVLNALNPNPYIFWAVVGGPLFLVGWRVSPLTGIGFVVTFYGILFLGLIALIVVFATAGKLDPRVNRILRFLAVLALLSFGIYNILAGSFSFFKMM